MTVHMSCCLSDGAWWGSRGEGVYLFVSSQSSLPLRELSQDTFAFCSGKFQCEEVEILFHSFFRVPDTFHALTLSAPCTFQEGEGSGGRCWLSENKVEANSLLLFPRIRINPRTEPRMGLSLQKCTWWG